VIDLGDHMLTDREHDHNHMRIILPIYYMSTDQGAFRVRFPQLFSSTNIGENHESRAGSEVSGWCATLKLRCFILDILLAVFVLRDYIPSVFQSPVGAGAKWSEEGC